MIHNVINMKKISLTGKALIIYLLIILKANFASAGFFEEGKLLFEKKHESGRMSANSNSKTN